MNGNELLEKLAGLQKALEAGNYNAAPSTLTQGAALQSEDLSPVMNLVTYDDKHIKLQKAIKVTPAKSTLHQFDRQLSYGSFGGSARLEGMVGQEETSDFVRIVVPMAYYSEVRRVTLQSTMVSTVDGRKSDEREAASAAKRIAGDIEFDLFRGQADFSNAGVFDGNPLAIPRLAGMVGLELQIRQSDFQRNAQDLMFSEYGSDSSVVIAGGPAGAGGVLQPANVEDASVRSAMNHGSADRLLVDPLVLSSYNKNTIANLQRIFLAGSPQDATGADLRRQWVSGGTVQLEASRFLSGKTSSPVSPRANTPGVPTLSVPTTPTGGSLAAGTYLYYVTGVNDLGEGARSATASATAALNDQVNFDITPGTGSPTHFNVYRTTTNGSIATAKFIGRVANSGGATTAFVDLGNKLPGFVTGYLVEGSAMYAPELAPYSRMKLAVTDLSVPEAHYRFLCLAVPHPRHMVLIDNLTS